jgi:hypothetical protein
MFKVDEKVFSLCAEGDGRVLEAKKTIFKIRFRMCLIISVFFSGDQASAVASGGWPRWGIFGGNCSHLLQK